MTQNDEQDGKLTLRRPGRLELKKTVETGQVRQSFSHGRTKSVTVEVKKKRTFERGVGGNMRAVSESANPVQTTEVEEGGVPDLGNLTEEERAARVRALRGAVHDALPPKVQPRFRHCASPIPTTATTATTAATAATTAGS